MSKFSKLRSMVFWFRTFQVNDDDVSCLISSRKGMGKSTLGLLLLKLYLLIFLRVCPVCGWEGLGVKKKVDGRLRWVSPKTCVNCKKDLVSVKYNLGVWKVWLRKYVAYDVDDFLSKLYSLPFFSPLFADEAVRFAMGEDWNKHESKEAKRALAQIRTKHLLMLMAIPKFKWLDRKYRDDMSTAWLRIVSKGRVVLFRPDLGEVDDAYHLGELQKLMGNYFYGDPNLDRILGKLEKHPCYYDIFSYPRLSDPEYEAYLEVRNEFTLERRNEDSSVDPKEVGKFVAFNLINRWAELVAAVKASRFDKPTYRLLEEYMFCNPLSDNKPLIRYTSIRNWAGEISYAVKRSKK